MTELKMRKYFMDLLDKTDKVMIQYFSFTDTLLKTLQDSTEIEIFKEVINGKTSKDLLCDTTGRLQYFKEDTLLFEAYFSTRGTGSKFDKGVVTYFFKPDIYKTLFTYRAGMGIDQYFNYLKKHHSDTTKNNR